MIEIEPNFKFDNFYMTDQDHLDVSYNVTVPVIHVEEVVIDDENIKEEKEDEEEISVDINLLQASKRRHQRKYSSTDDTESDEEWEPEAPKYFRRKQSSSRRISICRSPTQRPVPQRRSPGTKLKITQWIVELLRNPKYNPKVITWVDEKCGVFMIKDTVAYAKLWGKIKHNDNMTYEKLSRAMRWVKIILRSFNKIYLLFLSRYSYKNDELRMVPEQRLTYKFGENMINFRAENPEDPNFELIHQKLHR